jgi:hypothetical protein
VTSSLTTVGTIGTGVWEGTAITGTYIASSVALAGSPTTTTQTGSDSSTKIATTAFVAACTTISASNITTGTLPAAQLPAGTLQTATDGATITFALSSNLNDKWQTTLGGNRTLALSGGFTGQVFTLLINQDATGTRTVTWFSTIRWAGGTAPTLTTTASKSDLFVFECIGSGSYLGSVAGQNY